MRIRTSKTKLSPHDTPEPEPDKHFRSSLIESDAESYIYQAEFVATVFMCWECFWHH